MRLISLAALSLALGFTACGHSNEGATGGSGGTLGDAGNGKTLGGAAGEAGAGGSGPLVEVGAPCSYDEDCNDGIYCNGAEHCVEVVAGGSAKYCRRSPEGPCPDADCSERYKCDCGPDRKKGDMDGDGAYVVGCTREGEKPDCDDHDHDRFPGNPERCSLDDPTHDEDCDPSTFGSRDDDNDGFLDASCQNANPYYAKLMIGGDDCADDDPNTNPNAREVCDGVDNDCNGLPDDVVPGQAGEKLHVFYLDADHDFHGDQNSEGLPTLCPNPPPGYSFEQSDCDDHDPGVNSDRPEICNGKDDDCDGTIDQPRQEGTLLFDEPFDGVTTFVCPPCDPGEEDCGWEIQECPPGRLNCGDKSYLDACETPGTTLENCGECGRACSFSCSAVTGSDPLAYDCDELEQLDVGPLHVCGVTTHDKAVCWGDGATGQLGRGSTANGESPEAVVDLKSVAEIAVGYQHTCAISGSDRRVYCWGRNAEGQLGTSSHSNALEPTVVHDFATELTGVLHVAAGSAHTCTVQQDGAVKCWGQTENGRLGEGTLEAGIAYVPRTVTGEDSLPVDDGERVVTGFAFSCMLTTSKTVACWGDNQTGQIGESTATSAFSRAHPIAGLTDVEDIQAGAAHVCTLSDGRVSCWGDDSLSQLGRPSSDQDYLPEVVSGLPDDIIQIAVGATTTCALSDAGEVWCWGENKAGVLGSPDLDTSATPRRIELPAAASWLSIGSSACVRLETDPRVLCWGDNSTSQLGAGAPDRNPHIEPAPIRPLGT